jgi:hypothetical protein
MVNMSILINLKKKIYDGWCNLGHKTHETCLNAYSTLVSILMSTRVEVVANSKFIFFNKVPFEVWKKSGWKA